MDTSEPKSAHRLQADSDGDSHQMIWWWKSHKGFALVTVGIVSTAATFVVSDRSLAFPAFFGGNPFTSVPLFVISPLIPLVALSLAQTMATPVSYRTAGRSIRWKEWGLSIIVLVAAGSATIISALLGWSHWIEYLRSLIGLFGLQLLLSPLLTFRYQSLSPTLYLFAAALVGRSPSGVINDWAWLIAPQFASWQMLQSSLLLLAGSAAAIRWNRRAIATAANG